jgi:hypothetical protein
MGVPCAPRLIDSPSVRETTLAQRWQAWVATVLLALAAGCSSAPLAGKSCPCSAGYMCCSPSMTCVVDASECICPSKPLANLLLTSGGTPIDGPDGGPPAVQFGVVPEQWVSYSFSGIGEPKPTLDGIPDGNGFHVTTNFAASVPDATQAFEGAGLSFQGDNYCVDGRNLIGVQFDLDKDLGGNQLVVGVVSNDDVATVFDTRGTCTEGIKCYGTTASIPPVVGTNTVSFDQLSGGTSQMPLNRGQIVKVQWQVSAGAQVDFTISNVQFLSR